MTQEQTEQPKGFKLTMKVEGAAMRHFMELASRHDATGALDCLILTGPGQLAGELADGQKFEGEGSWELPIYVTFHPVADGLGFMIAGEPARWKGKPMEKFASEVTIRNQEYSIPLPPELVEPESEKARTSLAPRAAPLPDTLRFFNDPVHGAAVRALARVADWEPCEGFSHALCQNYGKANVTIGLPDGQAVPGLWEYLLAGGARRVKAHYALWARYYEHERESPKVRFAVVSVPQFCADLGLKKHKNGGYRPEQKRDAMKLLHALASVEMRLEKTLPNNKRVRIKGAIWLRGAEAEEKDQYADLFGAAREGEPARWEPTGFSFMPGQFYDNPEWRQYHQYMGKIGAGLLHLDNREEWAILIGGYLATLARIGQYRARRLKIGTILKAVGLAQSKDAQRRAAENRTKFEDALDKLAVSEIGVIQSWKLDQVDITDPMEDDPDDPEAWAEYSAREVYPSGDWRNWIVEIAFPFAAEGAQLEASQTKAIAIAKREATKKAAQRAQKREPDAET
jgi:hypothetical protein